MENSNRGNITMQDKPKLNKAQEAKYIVALEASLEAFWMRKFIDGLGNVVPTNKEPMKMLCDNTSAIPIANDHEIIKGARYYQKKYHYIKKISRMEIFSVGSLFE
ncbi:hypothetical protein Tco_1562163 [Tanacetum coccineum]